MRKHNRERILSDLITYSRDIETISSDLALFSWDVQAPVVMLSQKHIFDLLDRFVSEEVSSKQVEDWANAIECREDIEFGPGCAHAIFLLANPDINFPITSELAKKIKMELGTGRWNYA